MRILPQEDVVRHMIVNKGRYALWLGAGASAEAGIETGTQMCTRIRDTLATANHIDSTDAVALDKWANDELKWSDLARRYLVCLRKGYPNPETRLAEFRRMFRDKQPSFCHHALALLMSKEYVHHTCLTTNFDHLIENAFAYHGLDCQGIRTTDECPFWSPNSDFSHVLKLHGDIDTRNILNTPGETMSIIGGMDKIVETMFSHLGLVVLGTTGNEYSIRSLFGSMRARASSGQGYLSFGLLWGIYLGSQRPRGMTNADVAWEVERRVVEGKVHPDIADMIRESDNDLFCFFPFWGTGDFLLGMMKLLAGHKNLYATALHHLDHEMRVRMTLEQAGLSEATVRDHLEKLRHHRKKPDDLGGHTIENALVAEGNSVTLHVSYGDVTSRSFMGSQHSSVRKAVISPDDTMLSAGGGVAYCLLTKAGSTQILNELGKFGEIPHGAVALTSGGALPVQFIFHCAALKIEDGPTYLVTPASITSCLEQVFGCVDRLCIGALWCPLIGAGTGVMAPLTSLQSIIDSAIKFDLGRPATATKLEIELVISREGVLPRHEVARELKKRKHFKLR